MTPSEDAATAPTIISPPPPQEAEEPSSPASIRGILQRINGNKPLMLAIACSAYLIYELLVNLVAVPEPHVRQHLLRGLIILSVYFGPTFIFMALLLWVPWTAVQIQRSIKGEVTQGFLFLAAWLLLFWVLDPSGLYGLIMPIFGHAGHLAPGHRRGLSPLLHSLIAPVFGLCLTLLLTMFGALLSRIVREAKILLPLAFIAGIIDIIGAMTPVGFTANVVRHNHKLVSAVSIAVPQPHGFAALPMLPPTIGPGDALFIAFFFAIVVRHKLNLKGTFWSFYTFLTVSLLLVNFTPIKAIGALAPMGVAVIVANMRYFEFSREEKFAVLYVAIMALAGTLGFFLYTNAHMFHHHQ